MARTMRDLWESTPYIWLSFETFQYNKKKGEKKYWAVSYCLSDPVYEVFLIYFKDLIYFKVDRCILILVMLSYTLSGHSFLQ